MISMDRKLKQHVIGILQSDPPLMVECNGQLLIHSIGKAGIAIELCTKDLDYEEIYENKDISKAVETFLSLKDAINLSSASFSLTAKCLENEKFGSKAKAFYLRALSARKIKIPKFFA